MADDKKKAATPEPNLDGFEQVTGELCKLEVGEWVLGAYTGKGGYDTAPDKNGETKRVNMYDLALGQASDPTRKGKQRIPGVTQIDDAFAKAPVGSIVFIKRMPDTTSTGRRTVQVFDVRVKKPA